MLVCPVRDCRCALVRDSRTVACEQRHSFDVARAGYVNLLQPQDRRSKQPGDTESATAGRRRLYDRGVADKLLDAVADLIQPSPEDVVLDAGCGEGFYLGNLQRRFAFEAHGVDISIPAVNAAARRYPECHWFVANADRSLPYADESFTLVMSITARMNPVEFRRVLRASGGRLLVAIPAPQDLVELRGGEERDRVERTTAEFTEGGRFKLVEHRRVSSVVELDAAGVSEARHSIYRPQRSPRDEAATEGPRSLTFALDLLLFR